MESADMRFMPRRHKFFLAAIGVLIVIGAALAFFLYSTANAPANGVISGSTTGGNPVNKFDSTPRVATGKYATFVYPVGMKPDNATPKVVYPTLENFTFSHTDIQSWNLAISVSALPSGMVSDISGYQFRKTKPDVYKESTVTIGSRDITLMTDVTAPGFSKVAFMVNNNKSVTVSLFGDDPLGQADLQTTFNTVLSTWQWL